MLPNLADLTLIHLGVVQNCHNFHERTLRGKGSRAAVRFFKYCLWCIAILRRDLKVNKCFFQSRPTLLVGEVGVTQKSTLCMLLIMFTIF